MTSGLVQRNAPAKQGRETSMGILIPMPVVCSVLSIVLYYELTHPPKKKFFFDPLATVYLGALTDM